ncbi:MAG: hypothetical protein WAM70_20110 [Pyrinomonadaceae bacterium]
MFTGSFVYRSASVVMRSRRVLLAGLCLVATFGVAVLASSSLARRTPVVSATNPRSVEVPSPTPSGTPAEGPQVIQGTYDPHAYPCNTPKHKFTVGPGKARIVVQLNAQVPANDLSVSLLFGSDQNATLIRTEDTGTCCEALVYEPAGGVPAGEYQIQVCQTPNTQGVPQNAPFDYTGTFTADSTAPGPAAQPTPVIVMPTPLPTPGPGAVAPPAIFGRNTITDFTAIAGEPFIRVDRQDNIFVSAPFGVSTTASMIWKSSDHGRTFIALGAPIVRDGVVTPGGGDTAQDFDDRNRLYYSDLSAACVTVAVSEDGGNTFPATQNNFLTCVGSGDNVEGVTDDRQWVAGFGDGIAYVTMRNFAGSGFHLSKTTDAGRTWHGQSIGNVSQSGPLAIDRKLRKVLANGTEKDAIHLYQLYYTSNTLKVIRVVDFNDGTPLIINDLHVSTPGGPVANVFPVLAVDKQGHLYVAWSNGSQIRMVTSTDRGNTWSAPKQVSPASLPGTNIMPWIAAGDPGRVSIAWYRTPGGNNSSSVWDLHMAQSLDALSSAPSFTVNKVNENTIHNGEICLEGLGCDIETATGNRRDRSFLEFPSLDIDSRGAAYITYNDDSNQVPAPNVMVARQIGGASLFESVGMLSEPPGVVTVSAPAADTTVRSASMTLGGTHTLAPLNFDRDEVGDAKFPDHGAVIGSSIPALDIKSVSMSQSANNLVVTMDVGDLTTAALAAAPALAGGDGVLYLTQWRANSNIYWVGAEFRGTQSRFLTGSLGSINSATSKKYITYSPDAVNSLSVTGEVTRTVNGSIRMTIPKSLAGNPVAGTKFTSVTGYAFSQRGPLLPMAAGQPNPSSLPQQVDASGAATYVMGDGGPQFDGVVEVSIDDSNFAAPRSATLGSDISQSGWHLVLGGSDLVPGAHTIYVRQRINGRVPSPIVSVPFTVADTIEQTVTSMVSLATSNARSSGGISQYDMTIRNTSLQTIFAPVRLEVASITSAGNTVTVANADNGQAGPGAAWDYSNKLGADNALTANELSSAVSLRFNNPNNAAFTAVFRVIGGLARASGSSATSYEAGAATPSSAAAPGPAGTGPLPEVLLGITYNPVLNLVTVKVLKP